VSSTDDAINWNAVDWGQRSLMDWCGRIAPHRRRGVDRRSDAHERIGSQRLPV